jgi:hypothetical protein
MDITLVGFPNDGLEIPPSNLGDGPPGGETEVEDSLPPGDWFGGLMAEAGFDDSFATWDQTATDDSLYNYNEWFIDGSEVDSWGQDFNIKLQGHDFRVENTRAVSNNGDETWIAKWSYNGMEVGSVIQTIDESGLNIYQVDAMGTLIEHTYHSPESFRLVAGQLVILD